jgi:hypothetical protein
MKALLPKHLLLWWFSPRWKHRCSKGERGLSTDFAYFVFKEIDGGFDRHIDIGSREIVKTGGMPQHS